VQEEKHPRFDQPRREERSGADTDLPIREGIVSVIHARTRAQIERTQIVRSWPHRTRVSQADNARGTDVMKKRSAASA
jgi:hypothetical protein